MRFVKPLKILALARQLKALARAFPQDGDPVRRHGGAQSQRNLG
ncbi:MAG: hypothetical protein PHN90_07410 [Methanothrix sp.]|jgi:hypothetical protein|nr:hypothetical protein [Methanothrix sp.]HNR57782.1 hypothetical protein [Methanothrix sp.]HOI70212.1 hypothetical protein [Methanothrix sp.]HPY72534.1 hypothetical protein [Methanothrix sp.]HQA62999.1 hypothetical protein [Methanothrix sp.]